MPDGPSKNIISVENLTFSWSDAVAPVIDIAEFTVARGERVFLRGPSGSGKTTLLSLISAVLSPDAGSIYVNDVALASLKGGQRDQFRVDNIGLVFQQFNLLPFLSVRENVMLPCHFSKSRGVQALRGGASQAGNLLLETDRLLESMKLSQELLSKPVNELSVGQQQRVAVARALIGRPPLLIADEPTSALDTDTREAFLNLLFHEMDTSASSLLFVSHDMALAHYFDRTVDLHAINAASNSSLSGMGYP